MDEKQYKLHLGLDFVVAFARSKRDVGIPHYYHQSTFEIMWRPRVYAPLWEKSFQIGESRQALTEICMDIPEITHILYVDDDLTIVHPNSLMRMLEFLDRNNQYIVSGLYYRKQPPHYPLIMAMDEKDGQIIFAFPFRDKEPPKNSVMKVGAVPAGFLLVDKRVFTKIPKPWFVYNDKELAKKTTIVGVDPKPPGEDIYFSYKARKAGFDLWVHAGVDLLHYVPHFVGRKESVEQFVKEGESPELMIRNIKSGVKEFVRKQQEIGYGKRGFR